MKTLVILCLTLLVLSACIQFIGYRRHKKEFDAFYQHYAGSGHFIPPYLAFADGLGMLGTSLKVQWFLWILKRKKIKIRGQVWLDAKTYDFVQKTASPELQKWLAMDFILLLVEAIITTVGCIFIYLIKHQG
ncbi:MULTISPECIES: hypothetical protein [Serratia]|uniref:hypothetical protein n=1 Tax=Serratia TaxID=613 RepID=UPI0004E38393|nr:hypothetical protein [Serratia marcescens]ASM10045.1 hypothetical protein BVG91_24835 [Serratia marcescens]EIY8596920.1 hypothetical protein [Serratia marcescens]EIY8854219.1 hypothetical protein [Serratia marcescens]EIY8864232.1 hypothetical protein [Serratia marcescens]EIY9013732.1 hypothetical protein [Serratia marcescens]